MFSAAPAFSSSRSRGAHLYANIGVETGVGDASPHRLVAMLLDGFMDSISQAKGALQSGQVELKGRAIGRAVRIVEEGLKGGLDGNAGGKLAQDLGELYSYVSRRLTQANLLNDASALDECTRLMQPVREAWTAIAAQVEPPTAG
jgi:flagellar protein FliS